MRTPRFLFTPAFALVVLAACVCLPGRLHSEDPAGVRIVRNVTAEGACVVAGVTAEQSQRCALNRARERIVETANGVSVTASTLVKNHIVMMDLIKSFSHGHIIKEQARWLPIVQHQDDPATPPVPEYRVRLTADVAIPEQRVPHFAFTAKLNRYAFQDGESARLTIQTGKQCSLAVFNFASDDTVTRIFPVNDQPFLLQPGQSFSLPDGRWIEALDMHVFPGHAREVESFLAVCTVHNPQSALQGLEAQTPYPFTEFYRRYTGIAGYSEEIFLPYEVTAHD
jgi:hypothetical protein